MKILYCIAGTCHSGGMERVLANKANYLVSKGVEVVVVTTDQCGKEPFFRLDERIRCIDLGINYEENNGGSFLNKLLKYPFKQFRHKRLLRACLMNEKPDITVSMFCNDVSFISDIKDGSKKVLEIHFSKFKRLLYARKGLWRLADRWFSYKEEKWVGKFDRFVVLTEEDKSYWGDNYNISVIPNACTFIPVRYSDMNKKRVLAIGRYTYQKGFERLLEAWKLICNDFPEWKLDIVGDGDERTKLQMMVDEYGMADSVSLVYPDKNVENFYLNSSVLAMTSRYEGLPMVMLEAQAYGLPVVSFNCKCGPADIIEDGKNGFLVDDNDIALFAGKLKCLMTDFVLRESMHIESLKRAVRFSEEEVMGKWMALFGELCEK